MHNERGPGQGPLHITSVGMADVGSTRPSVYGNALHALGLLSLLADVQVKHTITVAGLHPGGALLIGDNSGASSQQQPCKGSISKQAARPSQAQAGSRPLSTRCSP